MRNPGDMPSLDEAIWAEAELTSAYKEIDHLAALVDALYAGVCGLIEALTPLPDVLLCRSTGQACPGESRGLAPVAVEHLRLALREAREALHIADTYL